MQLNKLPADVSRCHGLQCSTREQCQRYLDREHYQCNTPFVSHLCDGEGLAYYIPVEKQVHDFVREMDFTTQIQAAAKAKRDDVVKKKAKQMQINGSLFP